ncbi:hypothetical protein OUHCRE8_46090 [Enterobacter asburiae]
MATIRLLLTKADKLASGARKAQLNMVREAEVGGQAVLGRQDF